MTKVKIIETSYQSSLYLEGVTLRKALFFKNYENANELIQDSFEESGTHVIALNSKENVIGTGRLNFIDKTAIISQMTVAISFQQTGIGSKILEFLIDKSFYDPYITTIQLSARLTALGFYKKFNFKEKGNSFPSKKTGVLHQKMEQNR